MRALWLLWALSVKGRVRKIFGGLGRPRNLLMFVVGVAFFGGYLALLALPYGGSRSDPSLARLYGPPIMLGLFLLSLFVSLRNPGIYFQPAEIELLFPAPVSRRALLVYKLVSETAPIVLLSVFFGLFMRRVTGGYAAAAVGTLLFFLFNHLCLRAVALLGACVSERFRGRAFATALAAVLAAVAAAVAVLYLRARDPSELADTARAILRSDAWRAALAPFSILAEVFAAETALGLLAWSAAGAAITALAGWLVIRLDVDYREASIATSRRVQAQLDRVRRSSPFAVAPAEGARARGTLPMFPRWGGAGVLLWRQAVALRRGAGRLLRLLAIVAVGAAVAILASGRERDAGLVLIGVFGGLFTVFGVLLFRFDFRGDVEAMEALRALPVAPLRMAIGQLLLPAIAVAALQWAMCAAALGLKPEAWRWIAGAAFVVPLASGLAIALENLLFLYYPLRFAPAAGFDFQHMGRNIVLMLARGAAAGVIGAAAAAAGAVAWALTGAVAAAVLAASVVLAAFLVAAVAAVAHALKRFDVARDVA